MAEQLKHFKRIHTTSEPFFYSFALIGFNTKDNDSCVTLVRTNINRISAELRKWGVFTSYDIERIIKLKCGEQYYADKCSLVIRLS